MGAAEKLCLRWNDFESNVSSSFKQIRDDKDFFDVTLVCSGSNAKAGRALQAHKVILSACSPLFRTMLRDAQHHQVGQATPLLYLRGVNYREMACLLDFMYQGEVNVAQDELNEFLNAAEDLQIKGLTNKGQQDQDKETKSKTKKRSAAPSSMSSSSKSPVKTVIPKLTPKRRKKDEEPNVKEEVEGAYQEEGQEYQQEETLDDLGGDDGAAAADDPSGVNDDDYGDYTQEDYTDITDYGEGHDESKADLSAQNGENQALDDAQGVINS